MNTIILIHILWCLQDKGRGGAGVVRPCDVEDMVAGIPGITRYRVRKMFRDARAAGLLRFKGNHYALAAESDAFIDLSYAMAGVSNE